MLLYDCKDEAEWLEKRKGFLTASDAANYCGINPFDPDGKIKLWEEKTNQNICSSNVANLKAVRFGKEAEDHIRSIFMLRHMEYVLEYHQYGLYVSDEHPFMAATLDGLLHDIQGPESHILEIKTATVRNASALDEWRNGDLPINYWCQEIHQQICVPEAAGTWTAALVSLSWDSGLSYYFEIYHSREDMAEDRQMLLEKAKDMQRLITTKVRPATVIRL